MFRSFLIILLLGFSCSVDAQISARVTANLATTTTNITSKTGSRTITPTNVGAAIDSCLVIAGDAAALVASTGNLSAVLTLGNTAALPIHLDNGTTTTDIYPDHVETKKDAGGLLQTYLGILSGTPVMMLENSSGVGYSKLLSVASTNSIINSLPNEGGAGLPGTLVTHTTKDIITVTSPLDTTYVMGGTVKASGSGYSVTMDNAQVLADNGLGNTGALISGRLQFTNGTASLMTYGVGGMIYEDLATTNTTLVSFATPTAPHTVYFQNEGGYLALLDDTVHGSGQGVFVTKHEADSIAALLTSGAFKDRKTARTTSTTLASYTVGASDESLEISANVLITLSTSFNFSVFCNYTDEGNTPRSQLIALKDLAAIDVLAATDAAGAVTYAGIPLHIRAKSGTTVTFSTTGTFTSVTYNFEEAIKKL